MNKAKNVSKLTGLLAVSLGLFIFQTNTYADTAQSDPAVNTAVQSEQSQSSTVTTSDEPVAVDATATSDDTAVADQSTPAETVESDPTTESQPTTAEPSTVDTTESTSDEPTVAYDSQATDSSTADTTAADSTTDSQADVTADDATDSTVAQPVEDQNGSSDTTQSDTASDSSTTATTSDKDEITVSGIGDSTDSAIKQSSDNPFINFFTGITSGIAASIIYPLVASRQGAQFISKFRTLLSPNRWDVSQNWADLDEKYNPEYVKQYYTEAQDWYDNKAPKKLGRCRLPTVLELPEQLTSRMATPKRPLFTVKAGPLSQKEWVGFQRCSMTWATTS